MDSFSVTTRAKDDLVEITSDVQRIISKQNVSSGVCYVYTPHTTAAITINENADPTVKADILKGLRQLNLEGVKFSHLEGNSPSHIKSTLVGCSEVVFIENGRLNLGTWQGIFFCEFDGPRNRTVMVRCLI